MGEKVRRKEASALRCLTVNDIFDRVSNSDKIFNSKEIRALEGYQSI